MRHPRHLLPVSLLPALLACPAQPGGTTESSGASDGSSGSATDTEPTSTVTTEEPAPPVIPDNRYVLRIDDTPPPAVGVELDKAHALELFGDAAKDIKLLEVDSTALLTEVLSRIQSSCGDKWDDYVDTPDNQLPVSPGHDCTKSELGKTYGAGWKTSPQYAMVRLLTMTPRNAVVAGTELAEFEALFKQNENNFGGYSFSDVLAASLFCTGTQAEATACTQKLKSTNLDKTHEQGLHTRAFIPLDVLRETLKTTLLASHPNIANDQGLLPVTLYDALKDMQPLSEKLGPVGDHPGLLLPDDAEFTTYSDALTPQFKMIASAASNVRRVEGIDASVGKGEMSISLLSSPLSFDFNDEAKVKFEGLAELPTVDMRMAITELDAFVPSCEAGLGTCQPNLPESPIDGYVWSEPLWSLERIVGQAAMTAFAERVYKQCLVVLNPDCLAEVSIGNDGNPKGWSVFKTDFMSVDVPPPQYLWEMLLGVAQVAVHDPTGDGKTDIPEGQARPVFALYKVPLGLTADDLIAQLRPTMQSQADKIADTLAGNYWNKSAHLDFYYRRGSIDDAASPTYLFFVAPDDKRPVEGDPSQLAAYDYAKPGFFSDAALTTKVSATAIDGVDDVTHEKFLLPEGETTLFMQDDAGDAYQLRFTVPPGADPVEIVVRVTKI